MTNTEFLTGALNAGIHQIAENKAKAIHLKASHNRIGLVPLDADLEKQEYAAYQSANYRAEVRIDGDQNQITVFAGSSNTQVADGEVIFTAKASILVDGEVTQTKPLINGVAKFNLPIGTNVTLRVQGNWVVNYDYGGAAVPVFPGTFGLVNINFTDNFKLK